VLGNCGAASHWDLAEWSAGGLVGVRGESCGGELRVTAGAGPAGAVGGLPGAG
jgi:hypothetical protein